MSKPEFVYVPYIEATPDKLWQALTSSEFSKAYWFDTELRSDWRVGSSFARVMGWPAILSSLKSLLDTGTALAIPPSAPGTKGL